MEKYMKSVFVYLTEDTKDKLKKMAKADDRSVRSFLEKLIRTEWGRREGDHECKCDEKNCSGAVQQR